MTPTILKLHVGGKMERWIHSVCSVYSVLAFDSLWRIRVSVHFGSREDKKESTRKRRRMGSLSDGRARRQTSRYEDATNERARSLSRQSVSRAATDLTWMENRPPSRLDVKLVSGDGRRHAGARQEEEEATEREEGGLCSRIWLMTVKCSGKLVQRGRHS